MAITLGGVTLSDHLLLLGIDDAPALSVSARRTLGGSMVIQSRPLVGGRSLALQSEYHLTHAHLTAIKALENAGEVVALVHPRLSCNVLITSIEVEADFSYVDPGASGADPWYSGTINLIEV